jgi:hypothetical protein
MARTITNYSNADRQAMAEALSYAAPYGPIGVQCIDPCKCK